MVRTKSSTRVAALAFLAAILIAIGGTAHAGLLIYEGFNDNTEFGWASGSSWAAYLRSSATFGELAGNIDFSDFDDNFSSGGKAKGTTQVANNSRL
jgi:hypothetical protein